MTMVVTLLPSSNHRLTRQTGFKQVQLPPPQAWLLSMERSYCCTLYQYGNTASDLLPVFGDSKISGTPDSKQKGCHAQVRGRVLIRDFSTSN